MKQQSQQRIVFLALIALIMLPSAAMAYNTHLNVTLAETVNQNVTFAENFFLTENVTYNLIEGVLTVTNPGAETVFDNYVYLENIDALDTDFVYTSGREGFQAVYPDVNTSNTTYTDQINSTFYDLGIDLDEDNTNDLVRVNDTHIIFNLTSEYELQSFAFRNSSNSSINIGAGSPILDMQYNLTSVREDLEYNDGVQFGNFTLAGTVTTNSVLEAGTEVVFQITDSSRNIAVVHVPELRSGQQTVFNYNVSSTIVQPPLDIESDYTDSEFNTKVVAGDPFTVTLTATNVISVGPLINVNITLDAHQINVSNGTAWELFNFTLEDLNTTDGDYGNVTEASNTTWYWEAGGGTIAPTQSYNISFAIRAPETVGTSGTQLALIQTLEYRIDTTASTLNVSDVRSRGSIVFNETKQIVSPQDNESNTNVTWRSVPTLDTSENVTYTLEKVTLWVTSVLDPNQQEGDLNRTYTPNTDINLTNAAWVGAPWLFNFTDGSDVASPPPIIWIKPYWIIKNVGNQIINSSYTVNGTDLYLNYIYVVNGYWLEVEKQVIDSGDGIYDIRTTVENRGNGHTPQNLTVTVYDFVPTEFSAYNFTPGYNNASNVTGEFGGTAYRWDVGLRTNLSTSFAPRGDPSGLDVYSLNYTVNGTGDFSVSELYIVGLDPRLVDGAGTFEGASIVQGIASTSREMIYLMIVLFLIGINVANFMMTHRISRKLDEK